MNSSCSNSNVCIMKNTEVMTGYILVKAGEVSSLNSTKVYTVIFFILKPGSVVWLRITCIQTFLKTFSYKERDRKALINKDF